jgi:hypothetical protein
MKANDTRPIAPTTKTCVRTPSHDQPQLQFRHAALRRSIATSQMDGAQAADFEPDPGTSWLAY